MSCNIHLDGKKQTVNHVDANNNPLIIQKLIERLDDKEENLRTNIKAALIYISELPLGFDKVIHELRDKIKLLDEVFEEKGLKTLVHLLPKLEHYDDPLNLDQQTKQKYLPYVDSINKLILKYEDQACGVVVTETINFVYKIFPFVNPNLPTH